MFKVKSNFRSFFCEKKPEISSNAVYFAPNYSDFSPKLRISAADAQIPAVFVSIPRLFTNLWIRSLAHLAPAWITN